MLIRNLNISTNSQLTVKVDPCWTQERGNTLRRPRPDYAILLSLEQNLEGRNRPILSKESNVLRERVRGERNLKVRITDMGPLGAKKCILSSKNNHRHREHKNHKIVTLILLEPRLRNLRFSKVDRAAMGMDSRKLLARSNSTRLLRPANEF